MLSGRKARRRRRECRKLENSIVAHDTEGVRCREKVNK